MLNLFKIAFQQDHISQIQSRESNFKRVLSTKDLIGLGIGTVIGTGIYILPGHEAASNAGPAVLIALVVAILLSIISGLAFAEFASAFPVTGSAYSFGKIIYGRLIGWLLGWSLFLEYFLAVSAVAKSFSSYSQHFFPVLQNVPQFLLIVVFILFATLLASRGLALVKQVENKLVVVKISILMGFLILGIFFIQPQNYTPFYPVEFQTGLFGFGGIWTATTHVFFAFLGFDTIVANAAEAKNPTKIMPRGILLTVIISGLLYLALTAILLGIVHYQQLGVANPANYALEMIGLPNLAFIVTIGALISMITSIIALLLAGSRLIYAMGRDQLLPHFVTILDDKSHSPNYALYLLAAITSIFAIFLPSESLINLVIASTLFVFVFMNFGILLLRSRKDLKHSGFHMIGFPLLPLIGGLLSLFFLTQLSNHYLFIFFIYLLVGVIIFAGKIIYFKK